MELLLEQISTPWDTCLTDLFDVIGKKKSDLEILNQSGIKELGGSLLLTVRSKKYNYKIVKLLADLCRPGGRTDHRVQQLILDLTIGRSALPRAYENYECLSDRTYEWDYNNSVFLFYFMFIQPPPESVEV